MTEQRTFEYRDDEYQASAAVTVPEGAAVLQGIERVETDQGAVFLGPTLAMNSALVVEA